MCLILPIAFAVLVMLLALAWVRILDRSYRDGRPR
jgi:hypothetical protein